MPLVPTRPATSASAVPAVDLSGVKGLPKAVRSTLEQAETPEALEEVTARQIYEKRKAGSSAQYVNSPTGALQSLYRTLTGRDSVPTQEELAERFEPPAQPQAPTEQPSLFEAVPAEELPAQGDLFPQGPQQSTTGTDDTDSRASPGASAWTTRRTTTERCTASACTPRCWAGAASKPGTARSSAAATSRRAACYTSAYTIAGGIVRSSGSAAESSA